MRRRNISSIVRRLVIAATAATPLAACGSSDLAGLSTWGNADLAKPELSQIGNYTADRALAEARAHFRNNDFGYSTALYRRVVELSPNDPEGYIGLGASYDRLRRFDLADRVYEALYRLTGGTAQYYNNIGYSHMLRGDFKTAATYLKKAKQIDPQNAIIANNLEILAKVSAARSASKPRA